MTDGAGLHDSTALGEIEVEAMSLLAARRAKGLATYGVGLEGATLTASEFLDYAIEEVADQFLYLLAVRRKLQAEGTHNA